MFNFPHSEDVFTEIINEKSESAKSYQVNNENNQLTINSQKKLVFDGKYNSAKYQILNNSCEKLSSNEGYSILTNFPEAKELYDIGRSKRT